MQPSLLANKLNVSAKTLALLFTSIRITETGCWEWMGYRRKGYGSIKIRALSPNSLQTHRVCYQLVHGLLVPSVILHHKVEDGCMGPACCNPDHLMETTHSEHALVLTPNNPTYINAHRDHCAAGHPYTIASTYIVQRGDLKGTRQCRTCRNIAARRFRDARRVRPKHAKDPAAFKKECKRGHAMEGDNVRWVKSPCGPPQRSCRACEAIRSAEYAERANLVKAGILLPSAKRPDDICKHGHAMTRDNIHYNANGRGRICKICHQEAAERYYARKSLVS